MFGEHTNALKPTVPKMNRTSRHALITFLVVFQVCKVLRRSQVRFLSVSQIISFPSSDLNGLGHWPERAVDLAYPHVWIAHNEVRLIQRCQPLFLISHLRNSCNQINSGWREVHFTHTCGFCSPFTAIRPKTRLFGSGIFRRLFPRKHTVVLSSLCFLGTCQNVRIVFLQREAKHMLE